MISTKFAFGLRKILHPLPLPTKFVLGLEKVLRYLPLPTIFRKGLTIKVLQHTGDKVGYEVLVSYIQERELMKLPGDLIEIGSFVGRGTAKLAYFAKKFGKKVYTIDIFDIDMDKQKDVSGVRMSDIYQSYLERIKMDQWQAYHCMIKGLSNVVTIRKDSAKVKFPTDKRFMFGFIDGNHTPEYVMSDFYLVWRNLVSDGVVAFHDYGGSIPQVTTTVDSLISKHRKEINKIVKLPQKWVILVTKK